MRNKDFQQTLSKRYAGLPMELFDIQYIAITNDERALYALLHSGAQNRSDLSAYGSSSYYCKVLKCSRTTYKKWLKSLKSHGLVTVIENKGKTSRIYPKYIIPTSKNKTYVE